MPNVTTPYRPSKHKVSIKGSSEILFELAKYSLSHQWDIFKHTDTNISTVLATSGTILSIFLGIQIYAFSILEKIEVLSLQNVVSLLLFATVTGCLFFSIIFDLNALKYYVTYHIDPVEAIHHFKNKSKSKARDAAIVDLSGLWLKNQYILNFKKIINIRRAFNLLIIGLLLLIPSFISSGYS